jgi:thiol peroxidase
MNERKGEVTIHGDPLTLLGEFPQQGRAVSDFEVLANDLSAVKSADLKGKVCIICSVPSLDTGVCDTEARKFNEHAVSLGDDVAVRVISMDLPFAQARWCGAAGVDAVQTLSDHRDASFGKAFGVLIKELRLLARAVFVLDRDGAIKYTQLVAEVTDEPDYEAALEAAKKLL